MNSNDCVALVSLIMTPEQPQKEYKCNDTEGGSMQIQWVYYLHLYTRRLALSAFWRKGQARRWDRFLCLPQFGAQGTCPSCPLPSHSTRTSGYCVVVAPRLGYNTGPINLRHHIDVLQWRLPTTVTADQTIRLNHQRAGSSSVNASSLSGVLKYDTSSLLCLGDSIILPFRAHR